MELWQFLGTLHPKLVQFPLVLLLMGLLFDGAGAFLNSSRARWAGLVTSAAGTFGLLLAFICGIYAEIWAGRAGVPQHPIELHELVANIASWGFVILFAWRILLGDHADGPRLKWLRTYVVVGLLWYSLLLLAGYLGGQLVFEYGAGNEAAHRAAGITLSDLNTLAARQTDENLRYSEWMHHVFGLLTLGLAASLLAQAAFPRQARRLRWIVPIFLLAGGVFLFFSADLDLYKFTDPRQWRDREVQLHKSLATIMAIVGVVGLIKLRRNKVVPTPTSAEAMSPTASAAEIENQKSKIENGSNSKLVAVMALIGGSMLFTHIHTVAPYANVAAGVYIAHVVMGLVALSIGAARIAQEYLPRWRKGLAYAFGGLMLVEAVLLVTYNEGLPWFIGYGRYDRWGPGDTFQRALYTVAPFSKFRALMFVNQDLGKAFVSFRTHFAPPLKGDGSVPDDSVTLTFDDTPQLLVNTGNGEIALPLQRSDGGGLTGTNFYVQADFLKTTPYLSARLVLPLKGQRLVGYFDPWVTPNVVSVPANELATYQCPMHEGVRATKDMFDALHGKCPLCQMDLIPLKPPLPAGELHDAGYAMDTKIENIAGQARGARIGLMLRKGNLGDVPLSIMHEQLMHIVIVSADLQYFNHTHPKVLPLDLHVEGGGGDMKSTLYSVECTFPRAGRYVVFADCMPQGDRGQVFRVPLLVDDKGVQVAPSEPTSSTALQPDEGSKLLMPIAEPHTPQDPAAYDLSPAAPTQPLLAALMPAAAGPVLFVPPQPVLAEVVMQPRTLYAGLHAEFSFRLSDAQGRPISDLAPYLGAAGHCMAVSEDTTLMLHSHPEDVMGVGADWKGGPEVTFGLTFPKAGRYRLWGQFKRGGNVIVVPFTVDVHNPPVPAGMIRFLLNE